MNCFEKHSPCQNCPYRKDAPLQLWDVREFISLVQKEQDFFGAVYMCHKKDGSACIGWLMDQDKRRLPCIALRMQLSKQEVTVEYLDSLSCKSELYASVREMCMANYPEVFGQYFIDNPEKTDQYDRKIEPEK